MRKTKNRKGPGKSPWSKYRSDHQAILLRPFKPDNKDKKTQTPRFATIDIETQDWVNFVCGEVYWISENGKENSFETNDMTDLMMKCFEIAATEEITNFVAHYGGKFDFLFFIKELMTSMAASVENIIPRGAALLCFDAILNNSPKNEVSFKLPQRITFRDSSALLPFSLGSLTKSFNVETLKGEMDFLFVEKVYKEIDYLEDIINDDRCALFFNKRQAFKITSNMRQRPGLRYWNIERFNPFPFRGKISFVEPYMVKKNKKGEVVENDWLQTITYPIFTKADLLTYLHHDCKSLHQVISAFFNAPLICSSKKKWTTASQAVEVFRIFMDSNLHSLPDDDVFYNEGDVDGFVRQAYFGGRTEIFKPIFDDEINESDFLYYQDINSLYPFVMAQNEFPDKFIGWLDGENDYNEYEMSIWHCKVRVPENMYAPPLPVKRDDRLIFPVGEFKGWWTKYELEYARSLGCEILEYYDGAAFHNAGPIFKNFIETLYQMRLDAKEKNDNVTQMTMKLLMNSCYGRMGINKERSKIVLDDGTLNNIKLIAEIDIDERTSIRLSEKPERSRTMFSNPAIACYVTSYARVYLHQNMREVGERSVYYCDSVTKDRSVWVKKEDTGEIFTASFSSLWSIYAKNKSNRGSKEVADLGLKTLSWDADKQELEFKKIKQIIRHKTNKKIYEVRSKCGLTRVTEDHSLINEMNERIRPTELTRLFSPKLKLNQVICDNHSETYSLNTTFATNNETEAVAYSSKLSLRGIDHYFEYDINGFSFSITAGETSRVFENLQIREIKGYDDYVYDLSVEGNENFFDCMGIIGLHNTDSLFTDKPMKLGKELGAMKLEYKCRSACFLLPKTYVNEDIIEEDGKAKPIKLTMKGFDYKNIRNAFTVDDFLDYLNGEVGHISVLEKPKFATFKTALRMGEFVTMKNNPEINKMVDERREAVHLQKTGKKKKYLKKEYKVSVKRLQGYYTKRKIVKNGFDTEPLKLYE